MKSLSKFLPIVTCMLLPLFGYSTAAASEADHPDSCVDECTDDPGVDVLEIGPDCEHPENQVICVKPGDVFDLQLCQRNLDQLVRGYQVFMAFDPAALQIVDIVLTDDPYAKFIRREWNNTLGTINLARGIDDGANPPQEPTDEDALLATITFQAIAPACPKNDDGTFGTLVCMRDNLPPTRFSDEDGYPVYPCVRFTRVRVDELPPVAKDGCPDDLDLQCAEDVPPCDPNAPGWKDDCDPDFQFGCLPDQDNGGAGCVDDPLIITRTYWAEDCSGNYAECVQIITVVDNTKPEITDGPGPAEYQCAEDVPACDPNDVTATDNCDPNPRLECLPDEDNGGAGCVDDPLIITRRWVATDFCANESDPWVQTITVIDDTKPEITDGPGPAEYQCAEDVPACDPNDVTATDNCDPNPRLECLADEDNGGAGCADDPLIITRRWVATDFCANESDPWVQTITVIDDTDPKIECPDDVTDPPVECDEELTHPDNTGWPTCTDNCDPDPDCDYEDEIVAGHCEDAYTILRTWTCTDRCDNSDSCVQTIEVDDTTPPEITCPDDLTIECDDPDDPNDPNNVTGWATATDNCDTDVYIRWSDEIVAGSCEDQYTILRTWTAEDNCENTDSCVQTIEVVDTTPPEFEVDCPLPRIKVFPNVGDCFAYVCLDDLEAIDNCDTDVTVTVSRGDGMDLDDPYDIGDTTVWWVAEDNCGNAAICWQVIQVEAVNLMEVVVEVQGVLVSPRPRCVTFQLWDCPSGEPFMTIEETGLFLPEPDRHSATIELRVPCEYAVSCMTAQDRLHTTRSTWVFDPDDPNDVIEYFDDYSCPDPNDPNQLMPRTMYRAEYVDPRNPSDPDEIGHWLLGGNFDYCLWPDDCDWPDCDYWIDILDFGVYSSQYLQVVQCETPCPSCDVFWDHDPPGHSDANGDCDVDTEDFSWIYINFWKAYEPNCCGAPGAGAGRGPITRISVAELIERGWGDLAAGDLNHDGWLDVDDMEAFMNGARPKPPVKPSGPSSGGSTEAGGVGPVLP